jgi:hypothetical protein
VSLCNNIYTKNEDVFVSMMVINVYWATFKDSILLGISSQYLMIYKDLITQNTNHLIFTVFRCIYINDGNKCILGDFSKTHLLGENSLFHIKCFVFAINISC